MSAPRRRRLASPTPRAGPVVPPRRVREAPGRGGEGTTAGTCSHDPRSPYVSVSCAPSGLARSFRRLTSPSLASLGACTLPTSVQRERAPWTTRGRVETNFSPHGSLLLQWTLATLHFIKVRGFSHFLQLLSNALPRTSCRPPVHRPNQTKSVSCVVAVGETPTRWRCLEQPDEQFAAVEFSDVPKQSDLRSSPYLSHGLSRRQPLHAPERSGVRFSLHADLHSASASRRLPWAQEFAVSCSAEHHNKLQS